MPCFALSNHKEKAPVVKTSTTQQVVKLIALGYVASLTNKSTYVFI